MKREQTERKHRGGKMRRLIYENTGNFDEKRKSDMEEKEMMLKKVYLTFFVFVFSFLIYGGKCQREVKGPIDIMPGDTCDFCKMHITEVKFAGEYILKDGRVKKFDDLGCLVLSYVKEKKNVKEIWVKDFETGEWLKAEDAVFSGGFTTPMAWGFVAFSAEKKEGMRFEELVEKIVQMRKERSPHMHTVE